MKSSVHYSRSGILSVWADIFVSNWEQDWEVSRPWHYWPVYAYDNSWWPKCRESHKISLITNALFPGKSGALLKRPQNARYFPNPLRYMYPPDSHNMKPTNSFKLKLGPSEMPYSYPAAVLPWKIQFLKFKQGVISFKFKADYVLAQELYVSHIEADSPPLVPCEEAAFVLRVTTSDPSQKSESLYTCTSVGQLIFGRFLP